MRFRNRICFQKVDIVSSVGTLSDYEKIKETKAWKFIRPLKVDIVSTFKKSGFSNLRLNAYFDGGQL